MVYKNAVFALGIALIFAKPSAAQRIENIRHEAFGDKIVIKYDIIGATVNQRFMIRAYCNHNGKTTEITAASNSNWRDVKGGEDRQIVWEVLNEKGLQELIADNVSFTIAGEGYESESSTNTNVNRGETLTIASKKSVLYGTITSQVDTYLEEVYNLITQYKNFGENAFESQSDLKRLDQRTERANEAYDKLLQNRRTFEQGVRDLWGSELLNCQTETFFKRTLDQMHRAFLLPLNDTVKQINELTRQYTSKSERNKKIERIKWEIEIRASQLEQEINSVKGDANGLYASLKQ